MLAKKHKVPVHAITCLRDLIAVLEHGGGKHLDPALLPRTRMYQA